MLTLGRRVLVQRGVLWGAEVSPPRVMPRTGSLTSEVSRVPAHGLGVQISSGGSYAAEVPLMERNRVAVMD